MRMAINQVTNQPNVLVEVFRAFLKRCLAVGKNNLLQFVGICHNKKVTRSRHATNTSCGNFMAVSLGK